MQPGDIVYVIPPPEFGGKWEPRPVLVLFEAPVGPRQDQVVVVAHMTTVDERFEADYDSDIILDWDDERLGLSEPTLLRCRHIAAYGRNRLSNHVVGSVDPEMLATARRIARELLAC